MYYKLGQAGVTNQGSFVLLQVRANVVTIGAASLTQIRATFVTNWGSYDKLGQNVLQIRAIIKSWGITLQNLPFQKIMFLKIHKIHQKTPMFESLFQVSSLQLC